jgi:metal-sulfur cluster biosynthetic enzyme
MAIDTDALKNAVTEVLRRIQDPEIRIGIVDLGLVYGIDVSEDAEVKIRMTLTTPACPYGEMLLGMAHRAAERVEGIKKVEIVLVWDPPWDPQQMATEQAKDQLGIW